jgi:putative flippase GtrA
MVHLLFTASPLTASTGSITEPADLACRAVVGVCSPPLANLCDVLRTALGYLVINTCTFGLDLTLLVLLHGVLGAPLAVAITASYSTSFAVSYVLNRRYNFRSHGALGGQLRVYVPLVVANYLLMIIGLGDGLTHLGLDYRLARLVAGAGEAVFMFCGMRWLVFRDVLITDTRAAAGKTRVSSR